jgi:hypothetical protein
VQYDNRSHADEEKKLNLKRELIKMLRVREYKKEDIIELLEFISDAIQITDTMKNRKCMKYLNFQSWR